MDCSTLDPLVVPVPEGAGKGLTVPGVYRLEEYTLTLCWNLGEPAPANLSPKEILVVACFLKRAKR